MKKNMLSIGITISGVTLLVLSYLSGTDASAVNGYEQVSKEKHDISNNHKEISNYTSEMPLVGVELFDYNDYNEKEYLVKASDVKKEEDINNESDNRWDIILTTEDVELLAKIVWVESRGESNKGQQAVIEVILNRMIHKEFKGNLYQVLSNKGQFSSWQSRNKANPTDKEYKNIQKVLEGKSEILDLSTVYFSTRPRNKDITARIGGHYFCRYENK